MQKGGDAVTELDATGAVRGDLDATLDEAPLPQAMHEQQRRQEGMPDLAPQAALMQKHPTIV